MLKVCNLQKATHHMWSFLSREGTMDKGLGLGDHLATNRGSYGGLDQSNRTGPIAQPLVHMDDGWISSSAAPGRDSMFRSSCELLCIGHIPWTYGLGCPLRQPNTLARHFRRWPISLHEPTPLRRESPLWLAPAVWRRTPRRHPNLRQQSTSIVQVCLVGGRWFWDKSCNPP